MDQERFKAIKIIMQRAQMNNCPVSAVKTTVYRDVVSGKKVFVNEFQNHGEFTVHSMSVRISCFDENIKLVGTIKDYKYQDVFATPGEEFGGNKIIACPNETINSFALEVTHVELEAGYFWDEAIRKIQNHEEESQVAVEMAPEISVEEAPTISENTHVMPETLEEEIFSDEISAHDKDVSITAMFENHETAENKTLEDATAEKKIILDENGSNEPVANMVEETPQEPKEMPQEPIETPQNQEETAQKTEETLAQTSDARESEESSEQQKGKKKKDKKEKKEKKPLPGPVKFLITLFIIAVLGIIAYMALDKYHKYTDYNRGAAYMANGNYEYAINVYTRLGSYEDSAALLAEAQKAYADSLLNAGQYEAAIAEYAKTAGQEEKIKECYNAWVLHLCEEKKNQEALELLQNAGVEFDAETVAHVKYQIGKSLYEEKDYKDAIIYLSETDGYNDSKNLIDDSYYQLGLELLNKGSYDQAMETFEKIKNYKDAAEQITKVNYLRGKNCMESASYEEAIRCFEQITDYEDSASLIQQCYYQQACSYLNGTDYEKAMEYFKLAQDYEDSSDKYNEALYAYLIEAMKTEVTQETMDLLNELPKNYEDSAAIIKTLKKYVDHVGEYKWTTSNDKEINEQGGFEDPVIVKLSYSDGNVNFTVDGHPVDLKLFTYKSDTTSDTYTMLNTTTITRTFNGKIHTYKKVIEE